MLMVTGKFTADKPSPRSGVTTLVLGLLCGTLGLLLGVNSPSPQLACIRAHVEVLTLSRGLSAPRRDSTTLVCIVVGYVGLLL
jgi:hypothetical protein